MTHEEAKIALLESQLKEAQGTAVGVMLRADRIVDGAHKALAEIDQARKTLLLARTRWEAFNGRAPKLLDMLSILALGVGEGGCWIGGLRWPIYLSILGAAGQLVVLRSWRKQFLALKETL